jgi:hypothetical protein
MPIEGMSPIGTMRRSAWPQKSVAIGVTADKRQTGSSINTQRMTDIVEKGLALIGEQ